MVEGEELEAIARRVIDSLFSSRESAARGPRSRAESSRSRGGCAGLPWQSGGYEWERLHRVRRSTISRPFALPLRWLARTRVDRCGRKSWCERVRVLEIFIEQALVAPVCGGVQVEVSEGAAVGVFNKVPLPRVIGRFSFSKANAPKPYSKSTERTSVDADGGGSPSSLGGDIDCDQVDGPIPTPPGDPDNLDGDSDGLSCE